MAPCEKCGHDPDRAVTARWVLVLNKRIDSANLRTVNAGASRWRYAKSRDEWQSLVMVARVNQRMTGAGSTQQRRVTIERQYAGRCQEMDHDNLTAGTKPLRDAMVRERVIYDDAPKHALIHVTQTRSDCNQTTVTIEELAADA